ncbi:hypothetical protein HMI54_004790 [Coelomomyces lativittatus]|nr:hypothetical protein HMI54_004790 [Coelomomyces lativittatus]
MMGGYTDEDNYAHGNSELDQVFTLHFWQFIDIFVYFSHKRITIPPVQWTLLAHQHGSLCLGTMIFEWEESLPDLHFFMYADSPRDHKNLSFACCDILVQLALYYKFDGWLINIETVLPGGKAQAQDLCLLIAYLESELKKKISHSKVIWYDACTIEGMLEWQDKLSLLNKPFFDVCSGIFTNYTWKETYPKDSVTMCPEKAHDIFTGIDVFGRNTFGGGQFNVSFAADVALNAGTSIALFAPAWIYECHEKSLYHDLEHRLWNSLIQSFFKPKPIYPDGRMVYSSYFSTSSGNGFYLRGKLCSNKSWSNHALQSVITVLHQPGCHLSMKEVYWGSSSLYVQDNVCFTFHPTLLPPITGLCVLKGSEFVKHNGQMISDTLFEINGWKVFRIPFSFILRLEFSRPTYLGLLSFYSSTPSIPEHVQFEICDGWVVRKDVEFFDIPCEVYIQDQFEMIQIVPRFPLPKDFIDQKVILQYHKYWLP